MNNASLTLHRVKRFDVTGTKHNQGTTWREIQFEFEDGSTFKVAVFPIEQPLSVPFGIPNGDPETV